MELRVLQYFITIARYESISAAAEHLHITQPTLSRQIKDLEEELNTTLFIRGNRKITLTDDGILFKQRAQEILHLVDKATDEIKNETDEISGTIYIGCCESSHMELIAKAIKNMKDLYPDVKFSIHSGNAQDIANMLENGMIDFGLIIEPFDLTSYDYLKLNTQEIWGVLMKKDDPLSSKEYITSEDLYQKPLIISNQDIVKNEISGWLNGNSRDLNIVATYNLIYNATLLAKENVGYVMTLEGLTKYFDDELVFKRLHPLLKDDISLIYKKYTLHSQTVNIFLKIIEQQIKKQA